MEVWELRIEGVSILTWLWLDENLQCVLVTFTVFGIVKGCFYRPAKFVHVENSLDGDYYVRARGRFPYVRIVQMRSRHTHVY